MKQAVITGGNGTLAQAMAAVLIASDMHVLSPSHSELDVCDISAIDSYFQQNAADLLVCAAGITRDAPIFQTTEMDWDQVIAVNYEGAAACTRAVLPGMIEKKSGHIIFISSYSAIHPPSGQVNYATAKSALLGLTTDLARRYGPLNIRVNAILPGFIESQMTSNVGEKRRAEIFENHVLKRFNTAKMVARFVRHLHFDLPHTSGQIFQLDSRIG